MRKIATIAAFFFGLLAAFVRWLGNAKDIEEAPDFVRRLTQMWMFQSVDMIVIGCLLIAVSALYYIAWTDDWFERASEWFSGDDAGSARPSERTIVPDRRMVFALRSAASPLREAMRGYRYAPEDAREAYAKFRSARSAFAGSAFYKPEMDDVDDACREIMGMHGRGGDFDNARWVDLYERVGLAIKSVEDATAWVIGGDLTVSETTRWPDLQKWDANKEFTLWDASWLWANQEPPRQGEPISQEAQQAFRRLEAGLETRALKVRRSDSRERISDAYDLSAKGIKNKANPNWVASRDDLISFAHSISEKPQFLFPKERT